MSIASSMVNSNHSEGLCRIVFFVFYLVFGLIHELAHVLVSHIVFSADDLRFTATEGVNSGGVIAVLARALFGRYSIVSLPTDNQLARFFILHSGWILTCTLALTLHWNYLRLDGYSKGHAVNWMSIAAVAAYITSLEGIVTDLFGFIPAAALGNSQIEEGRLILYCGNFGVILLNSSWINIDGGKKALDILEKMVEVTMMRGAQSGGVVTYEPAGHSNTLLPKLKGIRSRVVNAKRTDLSKGVRRKIEKDNFGLFQGLRGSNSPEYSASVDEGRLVRAFFGHTRFATTSKASFDGTHPHQWSPRRDFHVYPFQSKEATQALPLVPEVTGVENYITHNGDFEFYKFGNGKYYDTAEVQTFLVKATGCPMPASVDSCAVAGMIDLLRTQGCWSLSVRYAICFATDAVDPANSFAEFPTLTEYEEAGKIFEKALSDFVMNHGTEDISASLDERSKLVDCIIGPFTTYLTSATNKTSSINDYIRHDEECGNVLKFVESVVGAFFDNDLFHTVRTFLENAKGSFGLSVSSSLDAHRQVCFAAKGQTLSLAFYPRKGIICFGSEQAAVKAGLNYDLPEGQPGNFTPVDEDAMRLDLDDLSGEICLVDWGYKDHNPSISPPNRMLSVEKLMGGAVSVVLHHQTNSMGKTSFRKRLVPLENNECIKPLLDDVDDPIRADIEDIPRICSGIQDEWNDASLNRLTAWNLAKCIRQRLKGHVNGTIKKGTTDVDILLTGCEVSLWLAEQFAADLNKCFPKLQIKTVSSNKLLGLFGQELAMPTIGFPFTSRTLDMHDDPIVIIVSHSGGTFSPLACSNLLQSFSRSIFAVTSEWDTQIGKQLRGMYDSKKDLLMSRIFSTEVGVRPAEPCSVSVAATHQLLTNIFEHICLTIISDPGFRAVSGAVVTETDLRILERCNRENITALEKMTGANKRGYADPDSSTMKSLRAAGDLWSEHILENVKAYIMSFIYIIVTVTSGYPLISGIATACGLKAEWAFYITRFFDAFIYFWLPQINVTILRIVQGRNIRHRMVGRTVVIGDIPWVAQAAEAFLGKIFACSYSIAGCGVLSGNPADHLVHRHTHRVVRGSLLVCGMPDGRLAALTTAEASACLAVNQASSIQSIGGTCESITIGHNPHKLPLAKRAIFLEKCRPDFLCEKILKDNDQKENEQRASVCKVVKPEQAPKESLKESLTRRFSMNSSETTGSTGNADEGLDRSRSSARLLGAYSNMEKEASTLSLYGNLTEKAHRKLDSASHVDAMIGKVVNDMMRDSRSVDQIRATFYQFDKDGSGELDLDEFMAAYKVLRPNVTDDQLKAMFEEADLDKGGTLDFEEFRIIASMPEIDVLRKIGIENRDERGILQVEPSKETYFGQDLSKLSPPGVGAFLMSQSQNLSMELYESRIASMQRFVAMTVMFHQMGMRVQSFFPKISFGFLGYRMDRTHSIMRIATTASPVSGADVRDRMVEIRLRSEINKFVGKIGSVWRKKKQTMNKAE